ncbi:MAG: choice-of-anchor X domain-containing protein [Chloroflexota bacterium]
MRPWFALPLSSALIGLSLLLPLAASAHEARDVGKYHFLVGFIQEPTVQNQLNGIDLTITTTAGNKPVVGANKTLQAAVIVGGNAKVMPLDLEPASDESPNDGKYAAYFIPTLPGSYTFHFTGSIKGDPIDQEFSSGPNTFGDVQAAQPLEFPLQQPGAGALQAQLSATQSAANQGRVIGIAGLVVALIAIGVAFVRKGSAPTDAV